MATAHNDPSTPPATAPPLPPSPLLGLACSSDDVDAVTFGPAAAVGVGVGVAEGDADVDMGVSVGVGVVEVVVVVVVEVVVGKYTGNTE